RFHVTGVQTCALPIWLEVGRNARYTLQRAATYNGHSCQLPTLGVFDMSQVTFHGNPVQVKGTLPAVGAIAPEFTLVGKDLADVKIARAPCRQRVLCSR